MIKLAREATVLVRDVMTPDVFVILAGTLATTAAALLAEQRVGAAPDLIGGQGGGRSARPPAHRSFPRDRRNRRQCWGARTYSRTL